MSNKTLSEIELPPMPQVVSKIIQIDENNIDVSSDQMQALIAVDPALTSKILKIANSAFYARANKISNLSQAITLLGFKTIKSLTLLVSTSSLFPRNRKYIKVQKELWMRAVLSALIAKIVAEKSGNRNIKDEAFMAALLKNIGQLILHNKYADEYEQVFNESEHGTVLSLLRAKEKKFFDTIAPEVSAFAMKKWNFPDELIKVGSVRDILDLEAVKETASTIGLICALSEIIVLLNNLTDDCDLSEPNREEKLKYFHIYADELEINDQAKTYFLENIEKSIREDSFYEFCQELFGM